jgi:hypothetical protein
MIEIVVVNLVTNLISCAVLGYLCYKTYVNRMTINSFPDPYQVIDEYMKMKIPVVFDERGQPVLPSAQEIKEKNPLVG